MARLGFYVVGVGCMRREQRRIVQKLIEQHAILNSDLKLV